jgi:asparagine synthase (glutamine-hydrolysing)
VGADAPERAAGRFAAAFERLCRLGGAEPMPQVGRPGWHLGRLPRQDDPAPAGRKLSQVHAAFHGVLHNASELAGKLSLPAQSSAEAVVLALYEREGDAGMTRLSGEFCLAVMDPAGGRVVLATDPVGNHALYWRADDWGLIFSTSLSALLRGWPGRRRLDLQAVADYLTIGAVMGRRTLTEGVTVLEPGTLLAYGVDGSVARTRYARMDRWFAPSGLGHDEYLEAVRHAFAGAVDRAFGSCEGVGLSLSGGLDSRAILATAGPRARGLLTYTLGIEGCADQAIGRRLSEIAGTNHRFFRLDDRYLRDFLPNMAAMVSMTDGLYLSHGLTEMLALRFLGETGIRILVRGHGGELAKARLAWPLHTDDTLSRMTSGAAAAEYLADRASYVSSGLPLTELLTPDAAAAAGPGAAASFAQALEGLELTPADCASYLYLSELHRRFTVPSLELFRTRVEVRLPFVDVEFLQVLLGGRSAWRDSTSLHRHIIASASPALARVRNSNTGAPADVGPAAEWALDKVNSVFKRLNVPGYRHYHNFDGWMRRTLLESVEAELTGASSRIQAFVRRDALGRLVRETREGRADRSYLLQALLILELWMREHDVTEAA